MLCQREAREGSGGVSGGVSWDPGQYLRYGDERARPFGDLVGRIGADRPGHVVDLGCGPGNATATLVDRWPTALVVGIDSSADMIGRAEVLAVPGRLDFRQEDLRDWEPNGEAGVDVIVSNAALQWVPGHLDLLGRFVAALAPGGWFAFQVPGNFTAPAHRLLGELCDAPEWRDQVGGGKTPAPASHEPAEYLTALAGLGCRVDAWETTYLHVLRGEDAVLDWMKGTGLRPVLDALTERDRDRFLAAYGEALREAYPRQPFGTVLPYRRVFVVAQRGT
jgi:trans-aconitate 2-methyltransferase